MSDWEKGSRNAFKNVYPGVRIYGCWFHYTQAIWQKIQKCGFASCYRNNPELALYLKKIMSIPLLPCDLIHATYAVIQPPTLQQLEKLKLDAFLRYFKRYWLTQVTPIELSVFELENGTNNGAESYHERLKCLFKTSHPRIWNFMVNPNDIISDYDNDITRLELGREITSHIEKNNSRLTLNIEMNAKKNLGVGYILHVNFYPLSITNSLTNTIVLDASSIICISDNSDECNMEEKGQELENQNLCVVCLNVRQDTWLFLPCKHANCCTQCSNTIAELALTCPTCRTTIVE